MNTKEALKRSLSSESDIKAKIAAFHKKTSGRTKISDAVEGLMELDLITPNDIAKVGLAEETCNSGFVREELKKIRDRFLHLREEGHEAISHEKIKETVEVLTYLMLPPGSK